MLDEASGKNENLQEYLNQFDAKKQDVKRVQILVDNHKSVLLLIQENVEEGLSFVKQNERIVQELKDTNWIILNLFQQADFLIVIWSLDKYITISENSFKRDQLLKEKSPMYSLTIFHLVDAYISKRGNEDRVTN